MADRLVCPSCSAWLLNARDAWCGQCGAPSARVDLRVRPDVLQINNVAPPVMVEVTNHSCADLQVEGTETPGWLTLQAAPQMLVAGTTAWLTGKARTMALRQPEAGTVTVRTSAGAAQGMLLVIEETPAFTISPSPLEVWASPAGERQPIMIHVEPVRGMLRIHDVRGGPLGGLKVLSGVQHPVLASPGSGATVIVQCDAVRGTPAASLTVQFDGPHGLTETEVRAEIALRKPPQIRWQGEHQPPAKRFNTAGQRLEFVLTNQSSDTDGGTGNAALALETVTLELQSTLHKPVPVRLLSRLPLLLRGGESAMVSFELTLTDAPVDPDRALVFSLRCMGNIVPFEKRVQVLVLPLPVFDGAVAIDFGSSNTCCALVESGREFEQVAFDGVNVSSPTVVRYLDLSGAEPETEIGARVKALAATSERVAASTIGDLKQRLGDVEDRIPVRPYNAEIWTSRSATDAAADYLRTIRRRLETSRETLFRDFILTHPAVCSLRQYRNLHQALRQAFGEHHRVRFLQEPIAALIPLLMGNARKAGMETYTVAAFDLGGGTTDMSIVRVQTSAFPGNRMEIRPTILFSRGVRFGGEDLSDFLAEQMESRSEALLATQRPGARLIKRGLPGCSMEDILRNRYALREAADQFKASLSEEATSAEPAQIILRVLPRNGQQAEDFTNPFRSLRNAGGSDLKWAFLKEVERHVQSVAAPLQAAAGQTELLDMIQLSGKTTYLPVVAQTIAAMFPKSRVLRAANPKECVVAGACLSQTLQGAAVRLVLPDSARRTTSSVGVFEVTTATFVPILPVDIEIPHGGLERALPRGWFGSERITLWENLGISEQELRERGSSLLHKLGTWVPERTVPEAEAEGWALHLLLKDFELSVTALGPSGEPVRFRSWEEAST